MSRSKETELSVRRKLMTEITKSQSNLTNIMDELYENKDNKSISAVKKVIDELELLSSDVELTESGHEYPWLSAQSSADKDTIKKLTNLDNLLVDNMKNVTKASHQISDVLIEKRSIDVSKEMKKIRQYVTDARNRYKQRLEFIKGLR